MHIVPGKMIKKLDDASSSPYRCYVGTVALARGDGLLTSAITTAMMPSPPKAHELSARPAAVPARRAGGAADSDLRLAIAGSPLSERLHAARAARLA